MKTLTKQQRAQTQSQTQLVLQHLQSGKTLTKLQALVDFDIMQLGSRICEIRMFFGQDCIKTDMIEGKNGKRYAEYKWNA